MKNILMKKINTLKPLIFSLILLGSLGVALANGPAWSVPPTTGDSLPPVNEGTALQDKKGTLSVGTLLNTAFSPLVTYSPFHAGIVKFHPFESILEVETNFYGPLNLYGIVDTNATTEKPLCTRGDGRVRLCSDVDFEPVQDIYYTDTNTVTFPTSTGVTGAVKFAIPGAVTCTTVQTSGTTWPNGTNLSGSSSSYAVKFYDWGRYTLTMNCNNNKAYSVTIDIKGKIIPAADGTPKKFLFTQSKVLEIKAQGGGGASGRTYTNNYLYCSGGSDGRSAYAHVTTSSTWNSSSGSLYTRPALYESGANLVHVGGGFGPAGAAYSANFNNYSDFTVSNESQCFGSGGSKLSYNSNMSSVTATNGGDARGHQGGCPGANLTSCTSSMDGYGGYGEKGGGGGAYVSGLYTIAANNYLYVFKGAAAHSTMGTAPKPASIIIEWK